MVNYLSLFAALSKDYSDKLIFLFNLLAKAKSRIIPISMAIVLIFFLRLWGFKKTLSFSLIIFLLLLVMFRVDNFIVGLFGKSEGSLIAVLVKPIFVFVMAFVFLYYCFMRD